MSPAFEVLCHNLIDKPLLLLKLTNQKYPSFISFHVRSTSQLVRSNLLSSRQDWRDWRKSGWSCRCLDGETALDFYCSRTFMPLCTCSSLSEVLNQKWILLETRGLTECDVSVWVHWLQQIDNLEGMVGCENMGDFHTVWSILLCVT